MMFGRFRIFLFLRVFVFALTIFLFLFFLFNVKLIILSVVFAILVIFQFQGIIYFVEKTNRELNRFFQSIGNDDFTQSFSFEKLGGSFRDLNQSFNDVIKQFLKLRSEKEEHFRYLRTVVRHVGVGLISFKSNGDVELINRAAKQLFNVTRLKNIKSLQEISKPLVKTLLKLKSGENASLKINADHQTMYLSIYATQFKLHGDLYSLVSIQNIRKEIEREQLSKELEIAWGVQKSLLPRDNPRIDGYDIAGACVPAKEVGGDYYDFIPLGKDKLAIVIGDVSGKGIPAAFYMTLVKGFVKSLVNEKISPKKVLIELNSLLCGTLEKKSFVTMIVSILDISAGKIIGARAGHNPAIHYSLSSDSLSLIKPDGMALGLRKGRIFGQSIEEFEVKLREGDWFILCTDGFTEARNKHLEEFGEERFVSAIRQNLNNDSNLLIGAVFDKVNQFEHHSSRVQKETTVQHDDMTIIAVRKKPHPAKPANKLIL